MRNLSGRRLADPVDTFRPQFWARAAPRPDFAILVYDAVDHKFFAATGIYDRCYGTGLAEVRELVHPAADPRRRGI